MTSTGRTSNEVVTDNALCMSQAELAETYGVGECVDRDDLPVGPP